MRIFIKDNSEAVKAAKDQAVEAALEEIGQIAEGYAKVLCPVDTGRLRNSITHQVGGSGKFTHNYTDDSGRLYTEGFRASTDSKLSVAIGTAVEYGKYVEVGASNRSPKPYLKPAAYDHMQEYRAIIQERLSAYLR